MFYLILGQAYSKNYLSIDNYNKLCINKNSKISMPKLKIDEDLEIVVFNREELALLDNYFKGSNLETAYMLGRYCGLRVNECFGIKWDNVDVNNGTITIDRQMQYQDGLIKLVPLKTRNAKRTIYMCDKLKVYMQQKYIENKQNTKKLAKLRKQNQKIIEDINGSPLSSTELVNSLSDGKIQTINSIKYHAKEIQKRYNITFKYHYLRHTYGTMMAELNTPDHLLCKQLGHGSIQVTQRYYLGVSTSGIDILKGNLNKL
jgi:integrase